jgi:hypothetical protein
MIFEMIPIKDVKIWAFYYSKMLDKTVKWHLMLNICNEGLPEGDSEVSSPLSAVKETVRPG